MKTPVYLFSMIFYLLPIVIMGQDSNVNSFQTKIKIVVSSKIAQIDSLKRNKAPLKEQARAYIDLAWVNINQSSSPIEAQKYVSLGDSLANVLKDTSLMAETQTILGRIYNRQGYDATSLEYQNRAYYLKAALRDTGRMAYSINLMGRVFLGQKKYKEALNFYMRGMKLKEAVGQEKTAILVFRSISLCHLNLGNLGKAKEYADKAFALVKDGTRKSARIYLVKAQIDFEEKNYASAITQGRVAEKYMVEHGADLDISGVQNFVGKTLLAMNRIQEAETKALSAYNLAVKEDHPTLIIDALEILQSVAEKKKQYKKAYQLNSELMQRRESFYKEEEIVKSKDFETLYRLKEREKIIIQLEAENEENLNKIIVQSHERRLLIISLIGVTLLLSSLAWFINFKRKTDKKISQKDSTIQNQRIKELVRQRKTIHLQSVIEGQEGERMRLSQEIHDGLGGLLSSARTYLKDKVDSDSAISKLIDQSCHEVREITNNLMPISLKVVGLKGSIEDLATRTEILGLECKLEIHQLNIEDKKMELAVYRIVQELVNNVLNHASANEILIQLIQSELFIDILIEDNGQGYDTHSKNRGMGLQNIHSRLELLNGKMDIESIIENGTTVTIKIPMTKTSGL